MTNQEKLDMDMMAEGELSRLQRQYRIMEGDRVAFSEETNRKLEKQRRIVETLRKEKRVLLEDLKVATSLGRRREDLEASAKAAAAVQRHQTVLAGIEKGKRDLAEMEHQIIKLEKQLKQLRSREVTDNEYKERVQSGRRAIQTLENRLENIVKRFCSVIAENKKMREEIEHLLKERSTFNSTWEKQLQELNSGKKYILDLVEQATVAYDQREDWCSKLQALRIRAQNDLFVHTQEMREMQRSLDHDKKLKEFLSIKGQKRVMKDLEEKETKKKEMEVENVQKQVHNFEDILTKIQEISGEKEIDKIKAAYLKQEEENFALFNYVNELDHELEILNDNLDILQKKINEQKVLNEQKSQQQMESIESLKDDLKRCTQNAKDDGKSLEETEETLRNVLNGIEEIFTSLRCERIPVLKLIGTQNGTKINNHNAMIYVGLIQKKVTDILNTIYFKERSSYKGRKPKIKD